MKTYDEFIQSIINARGRFGCGDEYHEQHHIIPRSMDGTDKKENLIDLYAKEHYEAHRLLALENPDNDKLVYAWWCMSTMKSKFTNERYHISAEEYEEARIAFSLLQSERYSGEGNPMHGVRRCGGDNPMYDVHRYGKDNPFYGKHHTDKTRKKMKESSKKRWQKHEEKEKLSQAAKERLQNPENNPMFGKHHTEEAKEKMKNHKCKAVYCVNINKLYRSARQAERDTGISQAGISRVCNGDQKTTGGYQWKYLYDQIKKDGTIISGAITLGLITEEEALSQLQNYKEIKYV